MKKILWLTVIFTLLFASHSFAATTLKVATGSDTTFTATLSGITKTNTDTFRLAIRTDAFPTSATTSLSGLVLDTPSDIDKKVDYTGTIAWNIAGYTNIKLNTTYYIRVIEITAASKASYASNTVTVTPGGKTASGALFLKAGSNGTDINATLSGITKDGLYKLVVSPDNFTSDSYTGTPPTALTPTADNSVKRSVFQAPLTTTSVSWVIPGFSANTPYYIRAVYYPLTGAKSPAPFIVSTAVVTTGTTVATPLIPLTTVKESDGSVTVTGKIDTTKITDFHAGDYTATLFYTTTVPPAGSKTMPLDSHPLDGAIKDDGTTTWSIGKSPLPKLSPSSTYYIQEIVYKFQKNPTSTDIAHFDSETGNVVNSAASQATYDQSHGYTLLSGFPNFTFLPDPDLCAQQRAAGLTPQFCDINDVLNYALKLLIGLSAVALVFRLMYEGFVYMTTDVPFIKASSKGAFYSALEGLLLAMTAFIILNTINPKLVNNQNSASLSQLSIGVTAPDEDTTPMISDTSTPTGGGAGACTAGITKVTVQKSTFVACSTYKTIPIANNLKLLLTAAYASGIQLGGGGFRTSAEQAALRRAHCNGDTTTANANCKPPTAPVGHSNHESGLAFDFTCNGSGKSLSSGDPCFKWLQANASKYGLKNFYKEAWHWSWDGR